MDFFTQTYWQNASMPDCETLGKVARPLFRASQAAPQRAVCQSDAQV